MQVQALEARLIPVAAALVGAGGELADGMRLVDEFREQFDLMLAEGRAPVEVESPLDEFRRLLGVV